MVRVRSRPCVLPNANSCMASPPATLIPISGQLSVSLRCESSEQRPAKPCLCQINVELLKKDPYDVSYFGTLIHLLYTLYGNVHREERREKWTTCANIC